MCYNVTGVRHVRDHVLWVRFEDGTEGEVDLAGELWGTVFDPLKTWSSSRRHRSRSTARSRGRTAPTSRRSFCIDRFRCPPRTPANFAPVLRRCDPCMRTTLTIDDCLARDLKEIAH